MYSVVTLNLQEMKSFLKVLGGSVCKVDKRKQY